jgi:hypothetical protein
MATQDKVSNVVEMEDGSKVDFGKRGILKREITFTGEGSERSATIVYNVANGQQFAQTIAMTDALLMEFAAHGASSKVGDAAAGCDLPSDAAMAVETILASLAQGKWSMRKASSAVGMTDFLTALAQVKGYTTDEEKARLRTNVAALSDTDRDTMRKAPKVAAIMAELRAARAALNAAAKAKQASVEGDAGENLFDNL